MLYEILEVINKEKTIPFSIFSDIELIEPYYIKDRKIIGSKKYENDIIQLIFQTERKIEDFILKKNFILLAEKNTKFAFLEYEDLTIEKDLIIELVNSLLSPYGYYLQSLTPTVEKIWSLIESAIQASHVEIDTEIGRVEIELLEQKKENLQLPIRKYPVARCQIIYDYMDTRLVFFFFVNRIQLQNKATFQLLHIINSLLSMYFVE